MKKIFTKFLILSIFSVSVLEMDKTKAFVPDYYLPSQNNLKKEVLILDNMLINFILCLN